MRTSRLVVCGILVGVAFLCPDPELKFAASSAVFVELLDFVWRLPR